MDGKEIEGREIEGKMAGRTEMMDGKEKGRETEGRIFCNAMPSGAYTCAAEGTPMVLTLE
eukprot:3401236-Amphidinium_carterae.1